MIGRMRLVPRPIVLGALSVALAACGTLLSLDDDDPTKPIQLPDGSADGPSDAITGDGGVTDGAPSPDAADAAMERPDDHFLTNFDPPDGGDQSPYFWDSKVVNGSTFAVSSVEAVSPPNSAHVVAALGGYLTKRIDKAAKLTLTFMLKVTVPPPADSNSVDVVAAYCGPAPFAEVRVAP